MAVSSVSEISAHRIADMSARLAGSRAKMASNWDNFSARAEVDQAMSSPDRIREILAGLKTSDADANSPVAPITGMVAGKKETVLN